MNTRRQPLALQAAQSVADDLGVGTSRARILRDSNNTVVHLAPVDLVARVSTTPHSRGSLEADLRIGRYLAARGAPIGRPATEVDPGPHFCSGFTVTLWEYHEQREGEQLSPTLVADALRAFHKAFRPFEGHLVPFTDHMDEAGKVLRDCSLTPALATPDRQLLQSRYESLKEALASVTFEAQPLHGEPHLDGNVLCTREGPLFIDFEAACLGPKEWDLTALPREVAAFYPHVDRFLLELLSDVRSLTVATWCWMQPDRALEVAEAAQHHLRDPDLRDEPQLVLFARFCTVDRPHIPRHVH